VFEGTSLKKGKEGVVLVIEEDLDKVDASLVGLEANVFDQLAGGIFMKLGGEVNWGKDEHGAAGADDGEDGTDQLAILGGHPGPAEVGVMGFG
jgi:hypothetical protein